MTKLTSNQLAVLRCIQQYIAEHRRAPLIREIQTSCQIASYKSVIDRLVALERKGFIRRRPNKHRGIRVVQRAELPAEMPAATMSVSGDTT